MYTQYFIKKKLYWNTVLSIWWCFVIFINFKIILGVKKKEKNLEVRKRQSAITNLWHWCVIAYRCTHTLISYMENKDTKSLEKERNRLCFLFLLVELIYFVISACSQKHGLVSLLRVLQFNAYILSDVIYYYFVWKYNFVNHVKVILYCRHLID